MTTEFKELLILPGHTELRTFNDEEEAYIDAQIMYPRNIEVEVVASDGSKIRMDINELVNKAGYR